MVNLIVENECYASIILCGSFAGVSAALLCFVRDFVQRAPR